MANMLGIGVFGTFGQPYGFQQAFNADCQFVHSLDLDSNEIDMFPGSEMFAVRREVVKGVYSVAFCLYTYIREMNANRNTTFLGTCIVLQGVYVEAEKIYKLLRELNTDLIENNQNVNNNTIQVRQVVNLAVREPSQFQSIKFNTKSIDDTPYYSTRVDAGKKYFVATEHIESAAQVITFFDEALKNYSDTDSLYFTFNEKIITSVNKKNTLGVINWEQFIEHKNLVKEDFITSKPLVKSEPELKNPVLANVSVDVSQSPAPSMQPVAPPVAQPSYKPQSAPPQPISTPAPPPTAPVPPSDFAFDGWGEALGPWDIEEATRRVNEYNRLLAYAKQLKARNDDMLEQKQKAIVQSTRELIEETEPPRPRQTAWGEIPVNNTEPQRGNSRRGNDDDDDRYLDPFYKKKPFIIIAAILLIMIIAGGYMSYKKHASKQEQQMEQPAGTTDTVPATHAAVDTSRPPDHPDDSGGH